jgi:hypothetical protein
MGANVAIIREMKIKAIVENKIRICQYGELGGKSIGKSSFMIGLIIIYVRNYIQPYN